MALGSFKGSTVSLLKSQGITNLGQLSFIPLGGLGEIGKNMALLEYDGQAVMIDAGLMFPDDDAPGGGLHHSGLQFSRGNPGPVEGRSPHPWPRGPYRGCPLYPSKAQRAYLWNETDLGFRESKAGRIKLQAPPTFVEVDPKKTFDIGPFHIEFIRVTHSIVDGCGIALTTPAGVVIHTGDFKIDPTPVDGIPTDLNRFADYGSKGVLMLMSDSTNVEREGYTLSEKVVGEEFETNIPQGQAPDYRGLFCQQYPPRSAGH